MKSEFKYITEINFSDLANWDAKIYFSNHLDFSSKFDLKQFSYFTKPAEIEKVKIEDNKEYKILGVKSYGLGAYLNRVSKGSDLKMKVYQKAKENHLFWCKVDTKNGAFGIITNELSDGLGSSNMTFAELDLNKIDINYLQLLFKSKVVNSYMDNKVTGSTNRKYIKFSDLLTTVKIPLPTLEFQEELFNKYKELFELSKNQEKKADELEEEIERYLLDELGIEFKENNLGKGLQFIQYKELKRWDVSYLINDVSISSRYNIISLKSCIGNFLKDDSNKSLRFESYNYPNEKFRYIGMEHIEKNIGMYNNPPLIFGTEIKSQTNIVPLGYFIYGKLRPYLNKYWLNENENENEKIICSSEFFVFKLKEHINKYFFQYVLSSTIVQFQISELTSGARMPRINESVFKGIQIPLPSIEKQNEIANHISSIKKEIKNLRKEAEKNKVLALTQFENEIFG